MLGVNPTKGNVKVYFGSRTVQLWWEERDRDPDVSEYIQTKTNLDLHFSETL